MHLRQTLDCQSRQGAVNKHSDTRPQNTTSTTQGAPSSAVMRAILAASTATAWLFVRSANPTGRPRSSGSTVCADRAHAFQPHVTRHLQRHGKNAHTPVRAARPCATCALAHRVSLCSPHPPRAVRHQPTALFDRPRWAPTRPGAWWRVQRGPRTGPQTDPRTGLQTGRCCWPLPPPPTPFNSTPDFEDLSRTQQILVLFFVLFFWQVTDRQPPGKAF